MAWAIARQWSIWSWEGMPKAGLRAQLGGPPEVLQHKPVVQPGEPSMGHRVRVLQVHKNLIHFP